MMVALACSKGPRSSRRPWWPGGGAAASGPPSSRAALALVAGGMRLGALYFHDAYDPRVAQDFARFAFAVALPGHGRSSSCAPVARPACQEAGFPSLATVLAMITLVPAAAGHVLSRPCGAGPSPGAC